MRLTEKQLIDLGLGQYVELIGSFAPGHEDSQRYQLVGYELMNRELRTVVPVWRDRKLCQQIARSKY